MPPTTPLERYLDGQLSEADRERVERALAANPGAQEQVRLQGEINEAMSRLFGEGPSALSIPVAKRRVNFGWALAAAAALLMAGAGVWAVYFRGGGVSGASPLGGVYRAQLAAGFVPKEVCTTREAFGEWMKTYYQRAIYPPASHEGVEFVGWSYAPAISGNSGVLLARVGGKEVIVVVDRGVMDKKPLTSAGDPGLRSFRRQIGTVVLYEVTPLDHASILPLLSEVP